MKLNISKKFGIVISAVLSATLSAMIIILITISQNRETNIAQKNINELNEIIKKSLYFSMNEGTSDVNPYIESISSSDNIKELRIIPSNLIKEDSEKDMDEIELDVLRTKQIKSIEEEFDNEPVIREVEFLSAENSCLECHEGNVGDVMATISIRTSIAETIASIRTQKWIAGFMALSTIVITLFLVMYFIKKKIIININEFIEMIKNIASGDLSTAIEKRSDDEIGEATEALSFLQSELKQAHEKMDKIAAYQKHEVDKLSLALEDIADGDFTVSYDIAEHDEDTDEVYKIFRNIQRSIYKTIGSLNAIISQVTYAANNVSQGAQQISDSTASLSQGATEQASSLEETTSSITELASQTQKNSENAKQADQLSGEARNNAENGNRQMQQMLQATVEINESSDQISKIIKVIDEIAFQTNLLALNAAVEAARAGVHGKGFAVVADEVRNLAQRSAEAAKETTELIEDSIKKAENGSDIANTTAEALSEIVTGVTKVTDLIGEIAGSSNEQAEGIEQVNQALIQIDQVTQSNTASAEESASASEELKSQAAYLKKLVSRFKLIENSKDGNEAEKIIEPEYEQEIVEELK